MLLPPSEMVDRGVFVIFVLWALFIGAVFYNG